MSAIVADFGLTVFEKQWRKRSATELGPATIDPRMWMMTVTDDQDRPKMLRHYEPLNEVPDLWERFVVPLRVVPLPQADQGRSPEANGC